MRDHKFDDPRFGQAILYTFLPEPEKGEQDVDENPGAAENETMSSHNDSDVTTSSITQPESLVRTVTRNTTSSVFFYIGLLFWFAC